MSEVTEIEMTGGSAKPAEGAERSGATHRLPCSWCGELKYLMPGTTWCGKCDEGEIRIGVEINNARTERREAKRRAKKK